MTYSVYGSPPFRKKMFHQWLYQIHSIPAINTMLYKTLNIQLTNPYLAINNDETYYACPVDMDIMKSLISKRHYFSLSGGLYHVQKCNDCVIPLCLNDNYAIKAQCSITVNNVSKYFISQLSLIITLWL